MIYVQIPFSHEFFQISIASAYRRYQRTQTMMISASKCRPLNRAGRLFAMAFQAYQTELTSLATHPRHIICKTQGRLDASPFTPATSTLLFLGWDQESTNTPWLDLQS